MFTETMQWYRSKVDGWLALILCMPLDRLHVQFGQGFFKTVMISPPDRNRFLYDLA